MRLGPSRRGTARCDLPGKAGQPPVASLASCLVRGWAKRRQRVRGPRDTASKVTHAGADVVKCAEGNITLGELGLSGAVLPGSESGARAHQDLPGTQEALSSPSRNGTGRGKSGLPSPRSVVSVAHPRHGGEAGCALVVPGPRRKRSGPGRTARSRSVLIVPSMSGNSPQGTRRREAAHQVWGLLEGKTTWDTEPRSPSQRNCSG